MDGPVNPLFHALASFVFAQEHDSQREARVYCRDAAIGNFTCRANSGESSIGPRRGRAGFHSPRARRTLDMMRVKFEDFSHVPRRSNFVAGGWDGGYLSRPPHGS